MAPYKNLKMRAHEFVVKIDISGYVCLITFIKVEFYISLHNFV